MTSISFDKILKKYIAHTGQSERQVAMDMGINPSQFNKWVNGTNIPYDRTITNLINQIPKFKKFIDTLNAADVHTLDNNIKAKATSQIKTQDTKTPTIEELLESKNYVIRLLNEKCAVLEENIVLIKEKLLRCEQAKAR